MPGFLAVFRYYFQSANYFPNSFTGLISVVLQLLRSARAKQFAVQITEPPAANTALEPATEELSRLTVFYSVSLISVLAE